MLAIINNKIPATVKSSIVCQNSGRVLTCKDGVLPGVRAALAGWMAGRKSIITPVDCSVYCFSTLVGTDGGPAASSEVLPTPKLSAETKIFKRCPRIAKK